MTAEQIAAWKAHDARRFEMAVAELVGWITSEGYTRADILNAMDEALEVSARHILRHGLKDVARKMRDAREAHGRPSLPADSCYRAENEVAS